MMNYTSILDLWERYSQLMGMDQSSDTIEEQNELIGKIEELMPFKNEEEHEQWLNVLMSFKFWEDFESLTLSIIERKENVLKIKRELEEQVNDISLDFVSYYDIETCSNHYLSDLYMECSDDHIGVYYSQQYKYFEENPTECEDALLELYDGESIAQMIKEDGLYALCCRAGVCYKYNKNYNELCEDEDNIKKLLIVRYLIKNDLFIFNKEELDKLLYESEDSNLDSLGSLLNIINEHKEQQSEQENK